MSVPGGVYSDRVDRTIDLKGRKAIAWIPVEGAGSQGNLHNRGGRTARLLRTKGQKTVGGGGGLRWVSAVQILRS